MEVSKAVEIMNKTVEKDIEITAIPIPIATCILDIYERLDKIENMLAKIKIEEGGKGFKR